MFSFIKNIFKGLLGQEKAHVAKSIEIPLSQRPAPKQSERIKNTKGAFGNPHWGLCNPHFINGKIIWQIVSIN